MSFRQISSEALSKLLKVLAHRDRIFILQELNQGELEVKALQAKLEISHSRVSQHLGQLRSLNLVKERRKGRRVLYRLTHPELAQWLLDALPFIEYRLDQSNTLRQALEQARHAWHEGPEEDEGENLIVITGRGP